MPGVSLLCRTDGSVEAQRASFLAALESTRWHDTWRQEVLLDHPACLIGCTRYQEYPVRTWDHAELFICLEGRIYGLTEEAMVAHVTDLALRMLGANPHDEITPRMLGLDGDFILFVFDAASSRLAVLTDALGTLPLYYGNRDGLFVASRHLGFVNSLLGGVSVDKMGVAQYLLLRYPLGERTLLEGVGRLGPATLLRVDPHACRVERRELYVCDFQELRHRDVDVVENARCLARLLCDASEVRAAGNGPTLVPLSGGIDSRLVAGALRDHRLDFTAITYEEPGKTDVQRAGEVARILGVDWRVLRTGPTQGKHALRLLRIKDGVAWARWSFQVPFLTRALDMFGTGAVCLTGDGGDKTLPDLTPPRSVSNAGEFLDVLLRLNAMLALDHVASLTGLSRADILSELEAVATGFPEESWAYRYVHFLVYGRACRWVGETQDKNRAFFWTTSPFYARAFFDHAMNVPASQKRRHALRRAVLRELCPETACVRDANYGVAPASMWYPVCLRAVGILSQFPRLWRGVKKLFFPGFHKRAYTQHSALVRCLRDQVANCHAISDVLSRPALEAMTDAADRHHIWEMETLFTVTSAIEYLATGQSSLERYCECALL